MLAAEALAEAAERAGIEPEALRICVRLTEIARRLWIAVVAETIRGFAKERGTVGLLLGRRGIFARAWILKNITTRYLPAFDVARFTAGAEQVLEAVEVRFQFRGAHAPVADRDVLRDKVCTVALDEAGALPEI